MARNDCLIPNKTNQLIKCRLKKIEEILIYKIFINLCGCLSRLCLIWRKEDDEKKLSRIPGTIDLGKLANHKMSRWVVLNTEDC